MPHYVLYFSSFLSAHRAMCQRDWRNGANSFIRARRQRPLHTVSARRPATPMTRKSNRRMRALSYCFRSSSARVGRRDIGVGRCQRTTWSIGWGCVLDHPARSVRRSQRGATMPWNWIISLVCFFRARWQTCDNLEMPTKTRWMRWDSRTDRWMDGWKRKEGKKRWKTAEVLVRPGTTWDATDGIEADSYSSLLAS